MIIKLKQSESTNSLAFDFCFSQFIHTLTNNNNYNSSTVKVTINLFILLLTVKQQFKKQNK